MAAPRPPLVAAQAAGAGVAGAGGARPAALGAGLVVQPPLPSPPSGPLCPGRAERGRLSREGTVSSTRRVPVLLSQKKMSCLSRLLSSARSCPQLSPTVPSCPQLSPSCPPSGQTPEGMGRRDSGRQVRAVPRQPRVRRWVTGPRSHPPTHGTSSGLGKGGCSDARCGAGGPRGRCAAGNEPVTEGHVMGPHLCDRHIRGRTRWLGLRGRERRLGSDR